MVDDGRRTDGRTTEHGYTISSPCEPDGSGELKRDNFTVKTLILSFGFVTIPGHTEDLVDYITQPRREETTTQTMQGQNAKQAESGTLFSII